MKRYDWIGIGLLCLVLTGCGQQMTEDMESSSEEVGTATTEIVQPAEIENYRKIPEELPAVGATVPYPGTRAHFSFTQEDTEFVFQETEDLWLYNQSEITALDTQFMLNAAGHKVTIEALDAGERQTWNAEQYHQVYADDVVTIYQGEQVETSGDVTASTDEDTPMFLTLYGLVYQVDMWQSLVMNQTISADTLYTKLAQMGTAIVPASEDEALSNVLDGLREETVLDDYKMAYREGVAHTGFIFCSPGSETADYEDISIYMSVRIPEWEDYAVLHVEAAPSFIDRLEDTGEVFDGYPIMADYTGELKYYILGENGRCIYLEGVPGEASNYMKSFSPKEAAYIFELVLCK